MESPPSFSTLSEVQPLSEDSGFLFTSGSFSSDSASGWHHVASELQESDFDERSLSLCESTEASERMYGDFFNTVKKGPAKSAPTTIEPPPEFQDNLEPFELNECVNKRLTHEEENIAKNAKCPSSEVTTITNFSPLYPRCLNAESLYERRSCFKHRIASPRLLCLSPGRGNRPSSRSSLSSRLSSSHNSLVTHFPADDSNFITQAISHDTLSANTLDIIDLYNVPFDSDIYAVPVDMLHPETNSKGKSKKHTKYIIKRGKCSSQDDGASAMPLDRNSKSKESKTKDTKSKCYSLPGCSKKNKDKDPDNGREPLTMKALETYFQTVYGNPNSIFRNITKERSEAHREMCRRVQYIEQSDSPEPYPIPRRATAVFLTESIEESNNNHNKKGNKNQKLNDKSGKRLLNQGQRGKISTVRMLKQSFCNLFRWRRSGSEEAEDGSGARPAGAAAVRRALPPLPQAHSSRRSARYYTTDFARSIEKVKDYGWYWGPLPVEAAEKVLADEPDGSFLVRDSSDDHYIFTLTFKLNGLRHVRIEHDQGSFCFGGCTMFKAATIVEFIENAVETSRNGRYLFFLNLRPLLGPVRVQLLHPVSRFKRVQSLQHMARFVILKYVRRDLVGELPLPRRLLDYLRVASYYTELADVDA